MNYEKAYKETLERAKESLKDGTISSNTISYIEEIFPELKESEDEKIRKELIRAFKFLNTIKFWNGIERTDILIWLEKQGEKFQYWKPSEEQLEALDYAYNSCPDTERGNYYEGVLGTIIDDLHKLSEKQGEQKLQGKSAIEAAKEEKVDNQNCIKPADKVEPKFHEGDRVFIEEIKGYKNGPFQIKTVDSFGYSFDEYYTIPFMYEDILSKWSIQDAKDGDVLCLQKDGKEHIIIYRGAIKERFMTFVSAYCAYNGIVDAFCFADDIAYGGIMPATKEQRDLLFQKMKESGYEWDAEKKELKKIHAIDEGKAEMDYCFTKMMNGEKISSTWSEEDEERIKSIISVLDVQVCWDGATGKKGNPYQKEIDWLKSLKPQNKWKPSDEQLDALQYVCRNLNPPPYDKIGWNSIKTLELMCQDLKKLTE